SKPHVQAECQAIRERVGLIEMSPMAKFEVSGPGAHAWLEQLFANRVPATPGRISLCHLLTVRGGVRAEFTVTRLQDDVFFLVSTPRGERHDFDCLWRALPYNGSVTLRNVTLERGCWTVVGPKARDILQGLSDEDLSNETFRWLTGRTGALGLASDVRMLRVNYEGELGWELYHPICYNLHLFDEITRAGAEHGLSMAGYRAIESLRLDKSYRAMYRDLNIEHTALESGLDRFVRFDKDYVGREALEKQRQAGLTRRMVTLAVETVDADAFMNEGVYRGDELVGRVTSGAHSHTFGHCLSLAYLHVQHADVGTQLEIPLLGKRRKATVIADTPYDPQNERPRR
ncbi:MAG: aminomethyltransferase family protein, partial [Gammaproteobacteria bacterium]|nr:aminomethyltransferase family protein [Gammaproteobacteria bacterium]